MNDSLLRKNCLWYQVYGYSRKSILLFYIATLYDLALGLSYTEISIISVFGTVFTLVSEIPTGVIADKWSRKKSLQIAALLDIVSLLFLILGRTFLFLCAAEILWGIGPACQSGADQALLYDAFDDKAAYDAFLSKLYSRGYLASAVATVLATTLFSINIYLPLVISLVLVIFSLFAISRFAEGKRTVTVNHASFFRFNKDTLCFIKENSALVNLLLLMSLCSVAIMSINSYYQPLLLDKGLDLKILGALMFEFNLLMSAGSKINRKIRLPSMPYRIAFVLGLSAMAAGISNLYLAIAVFGFYRFANGLLWPVMTYRSNLLIPSERRATVMSYQNMGTSVLSIFVDPAVGVALDRLGTGSFYFAFGIVCILLTFLLFLFYWKNRGKTRGAAPVPGENETGLKPQK